MTIGPNLGVSGSRVRFAMAKVEGSNPFIRFIGSPGDPGLPCVRQDGLDHLAEYLVKVVQAPVGGWAAGGLAVIEAESYRLRSRQQDHVGKLTRTVVADDPVGVYRRELTSLRLHCVLTPER
jgi:hypothetical protein